ncbi:dTDP-4-dehydrorhamnose reductase [subsurface metagenome]
MTNILVIGGSGLVGRILIKKTKDIAKVYATYNTTIINLEGAKFYQLDVRDANRVNELMKEIQPDIVINAAAKRNTGYCEKNPDEAYKVNVEGTKNIVNACKTINVKMVFISSSLVFDGTKGKYSEDDELNPLNTYGKQKVMAEKIIKDNLNNWLIIRASYIYGWFRGSDNFVTWVIENLKSGREIQISYDQFVTPIHVENFVDILVKLLEKDKSGIYHVGEGECLSKYEFVKRIKETFRFDEAIIKPISSEALNSNTVKPKNNCLDLNKIKNELDFSKYNIKNGLEIMKEEGIGLQTPIISDKQKEEKEGKYK